MTPPAVLALYLPLVAWAATGVGLLLTARRASSTPLLRLAAFFLALWSLFVTTALVWLIESGGLTEIVRLSHSPSEGLAVFAPSSVLLWAWGSVGVFALFLTVFVVNQLVGRGILLTLDPRPLPWPSGLPRPTTRTTLVALRGRAPTAFTFTLLERDAGRFRATRREVIAVSEGLLGRLTSQEVEAVLAHELAHVHGLDGRYLTFLRTLARLFRWDPVFAVFSRVLTRHEEFRADDLAVEWTGRPLALARSIYKSCLSTPPSPPVGAAGLLGIRPSPDRAEAIARIHRLLERAESRPPEARRG